MKFCKGCKHRIPFSIEDDGAHLSTCGMGRKNEMYDARFLVTGEGEEREFEYCTTMRTRPVNRGGCGQEGVLWEPVAPFSDQAQGPGFKVFTVEQAKAAGLI